MFDYETLRILWWLLLGIILIGFAIMDGFDLGVTTLLNFIAKTDTEKRIVINTIGPFWEGNQVWLVVGGGALFAAWPYVYAVSFSGFYIAMFLLLVALILRPVSFKYRSKVDNAIWKRFWDYCHFFSGFVPALVCGVAVGNVILGVPFDFDKDTLVITYSGDFFNLFNPYALFIGIISVVMLIMHGGVYTALKTEDPVSSRAENIAIIATLLLMILYIIASVWTFNMNGYVIVNNINTEGPSNPTNKQAIIEFGAWGLNFKNMLWVWIAPISVILGSIATILLLKTKKQGRAFIASATTVFGVVATFGVGIFPFILPSSSNPDHSLTVWDSSSSQLTLEFMLISTAILLPLIIIYTSWVYKVLRGKVTKKDISDNTGSY